MVEGLIKKGCIKNLRFNFIKIKKDLLFSFIICKRFFLGLEIYIFVILYIFLG